MYLHTYIYIYIYGGKLGEGSHVKSTILHIGPSMSFQINSGDGTCLCMYTPSTRSQVATGGPGAWVAWPPESLRSATKRT